MNKKTVIPLGVTAVLLLVTAGAYWWWYGEHVRIAADTISLKEEIAEADAERGRALQLRNESSQLSAEEEFIASHQVDASDIVSFLNYLENSGDMHGALVEVASVSDVATDNTVTVSLSISGSFSSVMKTLAQIEYGQYAIAVEGVTVDGSAEGKWVLTGKFRALTGGKTL